MILVKDTFYSDFIYKIRICKFNHNRFCSKYLSFKVRLRIKTKKFKKKICSNELFVIIGKANETYQGLKLIGIIAAINHLFFLR